MNNGSSMSMRLDWNRWRPWCLAGLFVAAIAIFFRPLVIVLGSSIRVDQYSQALFVPPFVVCLLYLDQRKWLREPRYHWSGAVLYAAFAVVFITGAAFPAAMDSSTRLSLYLILFTGTCISAFLFCYGPRALRATAFPWFLLVLMAPLPDALRDRVIAFLQHGSAIATDWFFSASGIPFVREGVVLSLPQVTLEIAKECSGIRSSVVLFFGGLVLAHLFLRSGWSKIALIILMVPLTIVKNGIRIFTLSTLGMYVNPSFLTGPLHHRGGIVFFGLAFLALWAMVWLLQKVEDRWLQPVGSQQPLPVR